MRVLYLDDEQPLVLLVARMLEHLGHAVSGFTNAGEALQAFKASPREFGLVLTDMSMPGMSGLEFAQQILVIDPKATVVIATGCEDHTARIWDTTTGKPITPPQSSGATSRSP